MDFQGGALELFGYALLAGLMVYLFVVGLAWGYAMLFAFIARNTRLSDGSSMTFLGKGGEIWWVVLLMFLSTFLPYIILGAWSSQESQLAGFFIFLVIGMLLSLYFSYLLIRWIINSVQFSWGGRLRFNGGFLGFLGWIVLMYISALLIILPFWVLSGYIRWLCNNTSSSAGDRLVWTGSGWELLWRIVAVSLASMLIIPIPWVMRWLIHWLIENVEIERTEAAAAVPSPSPAPVMA